MHDLETILVLVLLSFNFIPEMSHHPLTLTSSWLKDSSTVTLTPGDGTTVIKGGVICITDQIILQNGNKLRGGQEEQ